MASGWLEHEGNTYYCGTEDEGWAYTGWQYLEPGTYYFSEDSGSTNGQMNTGKVTYEDDGARIQAATPFLLSLFKNF